MLDERNLKWVIVGVFVGLVSVAIVILPRRPTPSFVPSMGPVPAGDTAGLETAGTGLRIECRDDDECVNTSKDDWNDGQGPLPRKFLRVLLYNDGPQTAEGCVVTMRAVTETERVRLDFRPLRRPAPLNMVQGQVGESRRQERPPQRQTRSGRPVLHDPLPRRGHDPPERRGV